MPKTVKKTKKKVEEQKSKTLNEEEENLVFEPIKDDEVPVIQIPSDWTPKTDLGKKVAAGEITNIDQILDNGLVILESEIVDSLLNVDSDLLLVGQAKGKFGGGQRRVFRQTQKKTREGNKPKFTTMAVIGNKDGYVGIGLGKSKETVPAREKAIKNAKLNLFKISRGSGSWESNSREASSIPYAVTGKCGSVEITLMPAPKGKGLVVEKECQKILAMAGIKDIWSKTRGQTKNRINMIKALERALRKLISTKMRPQEVEALSYQEGSTRVLENE